MADPQGLGLEDEVKKAFDGLHEALARATEASTALSALATRVHAISDVFDQIEAAVREGRRQIAGASAAIGGTQPAPPITRPTLVVPETAEPVQPVPAPFSDPGWQAAPEAAAPSTDSAWEPAPSDEPASEPMPADVETPAVVAAADVPAAARSEQREELVSFRLEFESRPGSLDLRAVDDAISEHPDVRDIALLDYDGHRATLKVWVAGGTSPIEVQQAIRDHVVRLFPPDSDVTVVALEDAA